VHTSNLFLTEPAVELAERLARITGWDDAKVFFAQCGATANEAAIKLARKHGKRQHPDKVRVVTLEGSFHGRTLATLEATGQPAKHVPFAPLAGFVDHVPTTTPTRCRRGHRRHLRGAARGRPGRGRGPARARRGAAAAREACDAHGALLIVDEVQTGIGRTGPWFAFQDTAGRARRRHRRQGARQRAADRGLHRPRRGRRGVRARRPRHHLRRQPGDLRRRQRRDRHDRGERLLGPGRDPRRRLRAGLRRWSATRAPRHGVRGRGLLLGLELDAPVAAEVEAACRDRHLLVNAVAADVLRLAPPLTVSREEVDLALATIADALRTGVAAHR
jgi:acetylornithine/N-succinyldiaminopimelate aminotransferase